jgi:hypothetical protein
MSYLASNLGRIYNEGTGRFPALHKNWRGYFVIGARQVHRLVMYAFDGARGPAEIVHHVNHVRHDNALHNLRYKSRREHAEEAYLAGTMRHRSGTTRALDPALAEMELGAVERGEKDIRMCALAIGRSPIWTAAKLANRRALRMQVGSARVLDVQEKAQAHADAVVNQETFWMLWPGHPELEVSNLGNTRDAETGRVWVRGACSGWKTRSYRTVVGAGPVHVAVMAVYGEPRPFEGAIIRHFPDSDRWNCAISNLRWGDYSQNGADSREQKVLPRGEGHHKATISVKKGNEGLRRFVTERWTEKQLAEFWSVTQSCAHSILSGQTRADITRPSGLSDARRGHGEKHHLARMTDAKVAELLGLFTQGWSRPKLAVHFDISELTVGQILARKTWKNVPEPHGFRAALEGRRKKELDPAAVQTAYDRYKADGWTVNRFATHLDITWGCARDIVEGRTWKSLRR